MLDITQLAIRNVLASFFSRTAKRSTKPRHTGKPLGGKFEQLETRDMLTSLVPVQGGTTEFTSGGIDFLYITSNTDTRATIQDATLLEMARDDMDAYYRRNSGGNSYIDTFDITPAFDLPQTFGSLNELTEAMKQAAVNAGYNLDDYTRIGYGFPNPTFSFGGGALGGGSALGGSLWVPDGVWGDYENGIRGFIHESLHSLGLGHANNYEFQTQIFDEDYNPATPLNGEVTQGGIDPYHFLGGEGSAGLDADIAAYQKYYIGWLDADNITVAPSDPTGTYRIYEHTSDTIPQGRKVALQLGNDPLGQGAIWLSYDPDNRNQEVLTRGVLATYYRPQSPAVPWALDLTPNTDHPQNPERPENNGRAARVDLYDAAAVVGETYAMPGFDFEFEVVATGGADGEQWADIEVRRADVIQLDPNLTTFNYDLGPEGSPVPPGLTALQPNSAGDVSWNLPVSAIDRGIPSDQIQRDIIFSSTQATLEHRVRDGVWRVTVTMGDGDEAHDAMAIAAEGVTRVSNVSTAAGQFTQSTFDVEVTDGALTLTFSDEGGTGDTWAVAGLDLELVEYRVELSDDLLYYDFGPEGQAVVDPLQNFFAPEAISPKDVGDIAWNGSVRAQENTASFVVDGVAQNVGDLADGVGAGDGLTGTGYMLYSEEPVHLRFSDNPPAAGASNLVVVKQLGSRWGYSNNGHTTIVSFAPRPTDRLLAEIDFSADTITSLEGQRFEVNGIAAGYDSGNLRFYANQIGGEQTPGAVGEFQVTGGAGSDAGRTGADWIGSDQAATLEHKVRNGVWRVTMRMGDAIARDQMRVYAEGVLIADGIDTAAQQYVYVGQGGPTSEETSFEVTVTDGSLSLEFSDAGGIDAGWVVNDLKLERVGLIVDTTATKFAYDLGSIYSTVEPGFDRLTEDFVTGDVYFSGGTMDYRDRYTYYLLTDPQPQFRDVVSPISGDRSQRTLEHKVSNGTWRVTMTLGDSLPPNTTSNTNVWAEGELIASGISTQSTNINGQRVQGLAYVTRSGVSTEEASFNVEVTDGSLSLGIAGIWGFSSLKLQKVASPPSVLPGDYNGDLRVDMADYTAWRDSLGAEVAAFDGADGDGSGVVDAGDYGIWKTRFGSAAVLSSVASAGTTNYALDAVSDVEPTPSARLVVTPTPADERRVLASYRGSLNSLRSAVSEKALRDFRAQLFAQWSSSLWLFGSNLATDAWLSSDFNAQPSYDASVPADFKVEAHLSPKASALEEYMATLETSLNTTNDILPKAMK